MALPNEAAPVRQALATLAEAAVTVHFDGINVWNEAINTDGTIRDGAWLAEATHLLDLSTWPAGTRLIVGKERPHPGAQLTFTDIDGHRVTAFITDTGSGSTATTAADASPCSVRRSPSAMSSTSRSSPLPFQWIPGLSQRLLALR